MDYKSPIKAVEKYLASYNDLPNNRTVNELLCRKGLWEKDLKINLSIRNIQKRTNNALEAVMNVKSLKMFNDWMYHKRIFTVDKDFVNDLMNTENIMFSKGLYEYLPFKTFYVDISECEELKKKVSIL